MNEKITIREMAEVLGALEIIKNFKIRSGVSGFNFKYIEDVFNEILKIIKNGHHCPHCGGDIKFRTLK